MFSFQMRECLQSIVKKGTIYLVNSSLDDIINSPIHYLFHSHPLRLFVNTFIVTERMDLEQFVYNINRQVIESIKRNKYRLGVVILSTTHLFNTSWSSNWNAKQFTSWWPWPFKKNHFLNVPLDDIYSWYKILTCIDCLVFPDPDPSLLEILQHLNRTCIFLMPLLWYINNITGTSAGALVVPPPHNYTTVWISIDVFSRTS